MICCQACGRMLGGGYRTFKTGVCNNSGVLGNYTTTNNGRSNTHFSFFEFYWALNFLFPPFNGFFCFCFLFSSPSPLLFLQFVEKVGCLELWIPIGSLQDQFMELVPDTYICFHFLYLFKCIQIYYCLCNCARQLFGIIYSFKSCLILTYHETVSLV